MKITIVTATWNSGATLRHTMRSVLSQSYPNIEHIIVDGGSTDDTMEIVHELEPDYQGRLRYISEKDKGIYDAMNKGIAMATGDIVGILNSDDFYTGDSVLSTVVSAFENGNIDAVYGDIHYVKDNDLQKCTRYYSSKLFIAAGCVSASCRPIRVFIAAKKYMRNTAASICRTKLLPILNVCCD